MCNVIFIFKQYIIGYFFKSNLKSRIRRNIIFLANLECKCCKNVHCFAISFFPISIELPRNRIRPVSLIN